MRSKPEPSPCRRADGTVNLDVEKKIIDELKRGKGGESNERPGILSC